MEKERNGLTTEEIRAGDYLTRVQRLEEELTCKLQYLSALREQYPTAALHERVQGGDISDSTALRAVKMQELKEEIAGLYNAIEHARHETELLLRSLPSPRVRNLLEMRYLSGFKWDTIASTLYVTPRAAMRMHKRALRTVHILLKERQARAAR